MMQKITASLATKLRMGQKYLHLLSTRSSVSCRPPASDLNPRSFPATHMAAVGFYEKRASIERIHCSEDFWLPGAESALLAVPSVPSPESVNYPFNPLHLDAQGEKSCDGNPEDWHKRVS